MIRRFVPSVIFMVSEIVNLINVVELIEVTRKVSSSRNLKRSESLLLVKHMPMASVYDYQINTSLSYREKSTIGDRWIINGMSWLVNKKNKEDNTVLAWMPIPKFETKDKEDIK